MVWSLALCPDDAKQDPGVYGAEFGVVFLAKDPRTASMQEGPDCLGLYHSGLEGEHYFRLVVELPYETVGRHLDSSLVIYADYNIVVDRRHQEAFTCRRKQRHIP